MEEARIYLDYAAATPLGRHVAAAMEPFETELFFNPSSPYVPAIEVRQAYDEAKDSIARLIGGRSSELIMTAGATESINLALGAVRGHVVTTAVEHQSVLAAAEQHEHTVVRVGEHGRVEPEAARAAIRSTTELVSVQLANNEIGTLQPLREIAAVVAEEREARRARGETRPIYLHSDASQGLGLVDMHVARLGVDMLTLNAAKVYGPKQVGLLWAAPHVQLQPVVLGGGQERGLRSGTENVAGVIGFAEALRHAEKKRKNEASRLRVLRDSLQDYLSERFPDAVISGDRKHRLPNFLHISFPSIDAERLLFALEARGVLVATGSACAANKGTRSHVLTAIGLPPEVADGSIRISVGRGTDEMQIQRAAHHIQEVVEAEYRRTGGGG